MGSNSRYDRDLPVATLEAEEARALHTIAGLLETRGELAVNHATTLQLAAVLRATAIELGHGRPVAHGVRRAVRAMANELRKLMDPRANRHRDAPRASSS